VISFTLPIVPPTTTSQQKRLAMIKGKAVFFHGKESTQAEADYLALMMQHKPKEPMLGPVSLSVTAVWPYLKKDVGTKKLQYREDLIWHDRKPDLSNWIKLIEDCLVRGRFIQDDSQVVHLKNIKKYRGRTPCIHIEIEEAMNG
jgi:Holliday junction resolvase RusA-like endonuclease